MPDSHMAFSLVLSASPVKKKELSPFVSLMATEFLLLSLGSMVAGARI